MISKSVFAIAAAVALSVSAPAAQAQEISTQSRDDLTCFAVFAAIFGDPESGLSGDERIAVSSGVTYYLGRLEGRDPQTDWLAYLRDNEEAIYTRVLDEAEFQRCGTEYSAVGARMVAAGSR